MKGNPECTRNRAEGELWKHRVRRFAQATAAMRKVDEVHTVASRTLGQSQPMYTAYDLDTIRSRTPPVSTMASSATPP